MLRRRSKQTLSLEERPLKKPDASVKKPSYFHLALYTRRSYAKPAKPKPAHI
jgi:hypothetical protein